MLISRRILVGQSLKTIARQTAGTAILIATLVSMACSTSAVPSQCVTAAQEAGLPESIIEQIQNPGDLNALERVALREALKKAGLDDICDQFN